MVLVNNKHFFIERMIKKMRRYVSANTTRANRKVVRRNNSRKVYSSKGVLRTKRRVLAASYVRDDGRIELPLNKVKSYLLDKADEIQTALADNYGVYVEDTGRYTYSAADSTDEMAAYKMSFRAEDGSVYDFVDFFYYDEYEDIVTPYDQMYDATDPMNQFYEEVADDQGAEFLY